MMIVNMYKCKLVLFDGEALESAKMLSLVVQKYGYTVCMSVY